MCDGGDYTRSDIWSVSICWQRFLQIALFLCVKGLDSSNTKDTSGHCSKSCWDDMID